MKQYLIIAIGTEQNILKNGVNEYTYLVYAESFEQAASKIQKRLAITFPSDTFRFSNMTIE